MIIGTRCSVGNPPTLDRAEKTTTRMPEHQVSVAILILAHKNLEQVSRLVGHLQSSFDVYLHLDKRSAISTKDFERFDRTTAIKKHKAGWGSLGIVLSTLELLTKASQGGPYDRFVLISGQDVPLKSNDDIHSFFSRHPTEDFVESREFTSADESRLTRITHFHFFSRKSLSGSFTRWPADVSRRPDQALWSLGIRRSMNYRFRWGSQWMDLTGDTVRRILKFVEDDRNFLKRFTFTFCPDEFFFQTAIEHCRSDTTALSDARRFTDWVSGPEHPRVLRSEDLVRVKESGMIFARKCDAAIDSHLIEALYRELARTP
jgi:hypothetical protein